MEQIKLSADDYILFAAIVEQASLVRAAEHLAMPKATVSRRLNNLEASLGQRLLIRTTRRLTLTEFGQKFLEHCNRIAEEVAATQVFVRSQEARPRGRLRVSMPGDYARQHFSRAIATFIETYPEIQLDLDLSARRVDLISERFDLAIRMGALAVRTGRRHPVETDTRQNRMGSRAARQAHVKFPRCYPATLAGWRRYRFLALPICC